MMQLTSLRRALLAPCCAFLLAGSPAQAASNFDELGGMEGIEKIVAQLIILIEADPRISAQFKESNMDLLARQLSTQFCQLSGGPCQRKGGSMSEVHKDMKITNLQFNALAEDLQIAMEKENIPTSAQNKLIAKLASMQREIVTK